MEYRTLGKSGLRVSLVGLGCNNFGGRIDYAASQPVVHKALDLGITLFDTADIYGSASAAPRSSWARASAAAQGHRARHQVRHADGRRAHARRSRARSSWPASRRACAG